MGRATSGCHALPNGLQIFLNRGHN
jgi:hypothetical protein